MSCKTIPDADDGVGDSIPVCREHTHTSSSKPTIQSPCTNSWRNNYRTSHWSSIRTSGLAPMDLKSKFHLQTIQKGHLGFWYPEVGVDSLTNCTSQMSVMISPARNCSQNKKSRKKVNLAWRHRRSAVKKLLRSLILAPGNWMRTLLASRDPVNHTQRTIPTKERTWTINYSCLFIVKRRISFNSDTEIGHKIGAPPRPRRTTNWCSSSLGHDEAEVAESVRGQRSTRFLGKRLASTHPWRK